MNPYDTPLTDAAQYELLHADTYTCWQETLKHARDLERKLTLCRDALEALKDAAECQQRDGLDRMEWIKRTASAALGEKPEPSDPFCTNCFRSVFDCQCPRPIVSR